jgi:hypothetical protein
MRFRTSPGIRNRRDSGHEPRHEHDQRDRHRERESDNDGELTRRLDERGALFAHRGFLDVNGAARNDVAK